MTIRHSNFDVAFMAVRGDPRETRPSWRRVPAGYMFG